MAGVNRFRNETIDGTDLDSGREAQVSGRVDARHQLTRALELEAGGEVDVLRESRRRQRLSRATYRVVNDYSGDGTRSGAYGSAHWTSRRGSARSRRARGSFEPDRRRDGVALAAGGVARLVGHARSRGATGVYQQFPTFEQVIGAWGTPGLSRSAPRRSTSAWSRRSASRRACRSRLRSRGARLSPPAGAEPRLVDGRFVPGSRPSRYENRVEGSARGIEMMLQRLDANGFSGWLSYSFGRNRYQRHGRGEPTGAISTSATP